MAEKLSGQGDLLSGSIAESGPRLLEFQETYPVAWEVARVRIHPATGTLLTGRAHLDDVVVGEERIVIGSDDGMKHARIELLWRGVDKAEGVGGLFRHLDWAPESFSWCGRVVLRRVLGDR